MLATEGEGGSDVVEWQPLKGADDEESAISQRDKQAIAICNTLIKEWVPSAEANVEVITGGITNALFKVTNVELGEENSKKAVILRVFGDNTDLLIDRKKELSVLLQLNEHGFGAKVLATFRNGRIEEYLTSKAMDYTQCVQEKYISKIAKLTAKFHLLNIDSPREPNLWDTVWDWYKTACGLEFSQDDAKREAYERIDFRSMKVELSEVQDMCTRIDPKIVWSHSDLLPGNIMLEADTDAMTFIDFEYSSYGYQCFDIGNHWNECMGLECNMELYPSVEKRRLFVQEYLEAFNGASPSEAEVDDLLLEAEFFVLVSHVFWCSWSIIQARYSKIDFDYIEYYQKRWEYFRQLKTETFSKLEARFNSK